MSCSDAASGGQQRFSTNDIKLSRSPRIHVCVTFVPCHSMHALRNYKPQRRGCSICITLYYRHMQVHVHPCIMAIKTVMSISIHAATMYITPFTTVSTVNFLSQRINQVLSLSLYICTHIYVLMYLSWFCDQPCTVTPAR